MTPKDILEAAGFDDILLLNSRRICVRTFGKEVLYEYIEEVKSDLFKDKK